MLDQKKYQSVVASLMYLSVCTRPDIAYAVGTLARYSSKPGKSHWASVKRVLRYLKGTTHHGIIFKGEESGKLVGYSHADWAGDQEDRKSILDIYSRWQADIFPGKVRSKTQLLSLCRSRECCSVQCCPGSCLAEETDVGTQSILRYYNYFGGQPIDHCHG